MNAAANASATSTYSLQIWDDLCGWETSEPCALTEAMRAARTYAIARVIDASGRTVWSKGESVIMYVVTVEFAGRRVSMFASNDHDVASRAAKTYPGFAAVVEQREVEPREIHALQSDCDHWSVIVIGGDM